MVNKLLLTSCLIFLFSFSLISAELIVGDTNEDNKIVELITDIPLNVTTGSQIFNMSDIWVTDEGLMDNVPDLYPTLDLRYLELDGSNFGFDSSYLSYANPNFDFDEVLLNRTIDNKIATIFYNATSIHLVDGILDDGDVESIWGFKDGDSYNISEEANKDFIIYINYTDVSNFNGMNVRAWYDADDSKAHDVDVCLWDWDLSNWDCEYHPHIHYSSEFEDYPFFVFDPASHIGTGGDLGDVRLALFHDNNNDKGRATHDFRVDYAVLTDGFTGFIPTGVPSLQSVVNAGNILNDASNIFSSSNSTWYMVNTTDLYVTNLHGGSPINILDDIDMPDYNITAKFINAININITNITVTNLNVTNIIVTSFEANQDINISPFNFTANFGFFENISVNANLFIETLNLGEGSESNPSVDLGGQGNGFFLIDVGEIGVILDGVKVIQFDDDGDYQLEVDGGIYSNEDIKAEVNLISAYAYISSAVLTNKVDGGVNTLNLSSDENINLRADGSIILQTTSGSPTLNVDTSNKRVAIGKAIVGNNALDVLGQTGGAGAGGQAIVLISGDGGIGVVGPPFLFKGGQGGDMTFISGAGGIASGSDQNNEGGAGGTFGFSSGVGGDADGTTGDPDNTGGVGGIFSFIGGAGGDAEDTTGGDNEGGVGAQLLITAGSGGSGANAGGTNTGGDGGKLQLSSGSGGTGATANGDAGEIIFRIGTTEKMRVDDSGYIGIETTAPSYPLEVNKFVGISNISIYALGNVSATGYITRTSVFDNSLNPFDYIKDANYYLDENSEIIHERFYGYSGQTEVADYSKPVIEEYQICYNKTISENKIRTLRECGFIERDNKYYYECWDETEEYVGNKQNCIPYLEEECEYTLVEKEEEEDYFTRNCTMVEKQNCIDITEEICEDIKETTYPYKKMEEGVSLNAEIDLLRQGLFELNERVIFLEGE